METSFNSPPWLVSIAAREEIDGTDFDHRGSGFAINPYYIATCAHVVEGILSVGRIFIVSNQREIAVCKVVRHPEPTADLALLKLVEPVEESAKLIYNRNDENFRQTKLSFVALGYPARGGGNRMSRSSYSAESLHYHHESEDCGNIDFIKTQKGVSEGFSGGPMCSEKDGALAVVGVNTYGGARAAVGGLTSSDTLIQFLNDTSEALKTDCKPWSLIDWDQWCSDAGESSDKHVDLQKSRQAYCRAIGLQEPKKDMHLSCRGKLFCASFVLVPPQMINGSLAKEGFWILQSVVQEELTGLTETGNATHPATGLSYQAVNNFIAKLSEENDLEFSLPTYSQWLSAMTAQGQLNFRKCRTYNGEISERFQGENKNDHPLNLHLAPRGLFEFCHSENAGHVQAFAPARAHSGAVHRIELSASCSEARTTFRLALQTI